MTLGWSGEWLPSRYAPLLLPVLTPDGRDPSTKLTSVVCNKTGSRCVSGTRARSLSLVSYPLTRRVVLPLKQTAHTVTKADRKKEKQAA